MSLATGTTPSLGPSRATWVEPLKPINPRIIRRSALENICARVHPTFTFFFKLKDGDDPYVHYDHLRYGLSQLLYRDEVLAGTLEEDDRGHYSVVIPEAPNAGVDFHYSDLSQDNKFPDFQYLEAAGFPYADGELDGLEKLRPNPFPLHQSGGPVLVSQLTHLRGGLVLFTAISHMVTDMVRAIDLFTQWSVGTRAIARAATRGFPSLPIPAQLANELTDVSRLLPEPKVPLSLQELKERSKSLQNFRFVDPTDPAGSISDMQNFVPESHLRPCTDDEEDYAREAVVGAWHFTKAALNDLHAKAIQVSPGVKMSVMDVFVAFLWSRYFAAKYPIDTSASSSSRGLYGEMPSESAVIFAMNIRSKIKPPLHPSYMGAAVDIARVEVSADLLLSRSGQGLKDISQVAIAVRRANSTWNQEHYMTLLELSQHTATSPGFIPIGPIDLLITDHRGFSSLLKNDWGPGLGRSLATREPYVGRSLPSGEVVIMPGKKEGDIEVSLSCERIILERLSRDAEMRQRGNLHFVTYNVVEAYQETLPMKAKL